METIQKVITGLLELLPDNPFDAMITELQGMGSWFYYLNYFIPVKGIVAAVTGWSICMTLYFSWSLVKKFIASLAK